MVEAKSVIQQNRERDAMRDAQVRELRKKAEQHWDEQQPEWFQEKFKSGKFKDMLSGQTVEAVMTLLSVVENLHALSTDCHSMQDDIATLEAWALNLYQ